MQLDGSTVSWAIPRGLLGVYAQYVNGWWWDKLIRSTVGMSKKAEKNRLAVETTLHPISYTVHEGEAGLHQIHGRSMLINVPVGADGTSERDCLLDTSSTLRFAKHSPMAKDAVHVSYKVISVGLSASAMGYRIVYHRLPSRHGPRVGERS
jgi:hypothetical protein